MFKVQGIASTLGIKGWLVVERNSWHCHLSSRGKARNSILLQQQFHNTKIQFHEFRD
jgi:hypothetical protein